MDERELIADILDLNRRLSALASEIFTALDDPMMIAAGLTQIRNSLSDLIDDYVSEIS